MDIYRKWKYAHEKRKDLGENNPSKLNLMDKIVYRIETSLFTKFLISIFLLLSFIVLFKYAFDNLFEILTSYLGISNIESQFPDNDSARYFYSAVAQSLAALLAISFSILLVYMQMIADKYSIQTIKHAFSNWKAVSIFSIFLITMVYSLFELCLIKNSSETSVTIYSNLSSLILVFMLVVFCVLLLIFFFFFIVNRIEPSNYIRETYKRIENAYLLRLGFVRDKYIEYNYIKDGVKDLENIKLSTFFEISNSEYQIKTKKCGLIRNINLSKLKKCSKILEEKSPESSLKICIPFNWEIKNSNFVLGSIESANDANANEISKLVTSAYSINNHNNNNFVTDCNNLSPISTFIIEMIKSSERDVSDEALREFTNLALKSIKYRKDFGLIGVDSQLDEAMLRFEFLSQFYQSFENITKTSIDQADLETINWILHYNKEIGFEAIDALDARSLHRATSFYLRLIYNFGDNHLDRIFHESDNLETKAIYDLRYQKEDENYVKKSEEILSTIIDYYEELTKLLIDRHSTLSTRCFYKLLDISKNINDFAYSNEKYKLKHELENLDKTSKNYLLVQNEIKVIEEKEKLSRNVQIFLNKKVYGLGIYFMINLENNNYKPEFVQKTLEVITEFFNLNNVYETFEKVVFEKKTLFKIEHWLDKIEDYQAHVLDTSYNERFLILISALIYKKHSRLSKSTNLNCFTKARIVTFEEELNKLNENIDVWNSILDSNAKFYFDEVLDKFKNFTIEQENALLDRVQKSSLSEEKLKSTILDITTSAEQNFEIRDFVRVEPIVENKELMTFHDLWRKARQGLVEPIENKWFIEKINFVDDDVDPHVYHGLEYLGKGIGEQIGINRSNYVLKQIYANLNVIENMFVFETFSVENLNIIKDKLEARGFAPNTIIASPDLDINFAMFGSNHWIEEIDIREDGALPDKTIILYDKNRIGTLKLSLIHI